MNLIHLPRPGMRQGRRGALALLSVICWLIAAGQCPAADNSQKDIAAYWTFDEGRGTVAYDYSGHSNQGELRGGVQWSEGKFGKALYFNGKDGLVDIEDGSWNQAAPFTYTVWYKRQAPGQVLEHMLGGAIAGAYAFDGNRMGMYDSAVTDTGARLETPNDEWVFAAITVSENEVKLYQNGELKASTPIKGFPRVPGALFIGARGTVGDQFFKGWIDDVARYHRVLEADEIRALYENYQKGAPPAPYAGLQVVDVSLPRLVYRPGESAIARITIKNFTNQKQQGTLVAKLVTALADEKPLPQVPLAMEPLGVAMLDVPVTLGDKEYGCQLRANVRFGDTTRPAIWGESVTADFAVAKDFWKVAIGGELPSGQVGHETPAEIARRLSLQRANYSNWVEMFFWAPDDWGCMAPSADREWWYSGQEGYYIRRDSLKSLIQQAHAYGMKAITYGKCTSAGPDGWEIARRHPDWFINDYLDRTAGAANAYDLDNWNNREGRESGQFKPSATWQYLSPDFRKQAPLDWGLEQIALSAREFGWDGVRFDGHFTVPNDELSTYNMRRMKERLWKDDPSFLFGFNYAFSPELYNGINHEMREGMAGAGMWMQEAIAAWAYTNSKRYTDWNLYATNELKVAKQIQAVGGTYHGIYHFTPDAKGLYKLIYSLIAGGHPVYGTHGKVPGAANWGRFMTRWSQFLWDPNIRPLAQSEQLIQVQSPARVLWQPLAQELVDSPQRKFWMVHVVNPPTTDTIDKTDNSHLPAPQQNVTVKLNPPAGERIVRAVLVQPENQPYDKPLTLDGQTVTIPRLENWAMVVVELEGKYKPIAPLPRFSSPPDPQQVAQAQQAAVTPGSAILDPLRPNLGITAGPNERVWETDSGFWNISADAVNDPDASGGLAQRAQVAGGYLGRTWLGPFPAGRYKFSLRMKWTGPNAERLKANVGITDGESKIYYIKHTVSLNDEAAAGHQPNAYQYHVLDVDIKEGDLAQCYVGVAGGLEDPRDAVYLDLIKTELVESYSDRQVAQWAKPIPRPDNLPPLEGFKPRKVLQVKGMYWQLYGVGKAVKCDSVYEIPKTYEALYNYDAVVMSNVEFAETYAMRKLYKDYVEDGGRLIILGGIMGFRKNWKNTYIDDILPVSIENGPLVKCQPPLVLGDAKNAPYTGSPSLFWRHDVAPRPGAEILAYAGNEAIVTRRKVGKGQVVVFAGTVSGEGKAKSPAFWESPAWTNLVKRMMWN